MRGRRPDSPDEQAAKGFPGKRKSKTQKQIAHAEEIAALLVAAPAESSDPLAPPAMLNDPRCAAPRAIWLDYVPRLARINAVTETDRHTFAMFCVYTAEFAAANAAIIDEGYSRNVKTISGSMMPRKNPNVERRDTACAFMLDLAKRFGLTATDRFNLLSQQRAVLQSGMLGNAGAQQQRSEGTAAASKPDAPADNSSPIGSLDSFDSDPPGFLPH